MECPVFKTGKLQDDSWLDRGLSAVCLALARSLRTPKSHLIDPDLLYWPQGLSLEGESQELQRDSLAFRVQAPCSQGSTDLA